MISTIHMALTFLFWTHLTQLYTFEWSSVYVHTFVNIKVRHVCLKLIRKNICTLCWRQSPLVGPGVLYMYVYKFCLYVVLIILHNELNIYHLHEWSQHLNPY